MPSIQTRSPSNLTHLTRLHQHTNRAKRRKTGWKGGKRKSSKTRNQIPPNATEESSGGGLQHLSSKLVTAHSKTCNLGSKLQKNCSLHFTSIRFTAPHLTSPHLFPSNSLIDSSMPPWEQSSVSMWRVLGCVWLLIWILWPNLKNLGRMCMANCSTPQTIHSFLVGSPNLSYPSELQGAWWGPWPHPFREAYLGDVHLVNILKSTSHFTGIYNLPSYWTGMLVISICYCVGHSNESHHHHYKLQWITLIY